MFEMDSDFCSILDRKIEARNKENSIQTYTEILIRIIRDKLREGKSQEAVKAWLLSDDKTFLEGKQMEQLEETFSYVNKYPRLKSEAVAFRLLRESEFMYMWADD